MTLTEVNGSYVDKDKVVALWNYVGRTAIVFERGAVAYTDGTPTEVNAILSREEEK